MKTSILYIYTFKMKSIFEIKITFSRERALERTDHERDKLSFACSTSTGGL